MSIPINDTLVPRTTGYKLIDSGNVAGSLQEVADITARDAIFDYNLKVGMFVYTAFEDKYWKCTNAITPTWTEFTSGATGLTSGRVVFATGATTVGGDGAFLWDNTSKRLSITTSTSALNIGHGNSNSFGIDIRTSKANDINCSILNTDPTGFGGFRLADENNAQRGSIGHGNSAAALSYAQNTNFFYSDLAFGDPWVWITGSNRLMSLFAGTSGNLNLGASKGDAGIKLRIQTEASSAGIELGDGSSLSQSTGGTGRIRYNNSNHIFEQSLNGGSWSAFSPFPFLATVGTWNQGVLSQDATDANFLSYVPNTAGTTSWYQWAGEFANGIHRPNEVMTFGWNQSDGGSRQSTGLFDGALWSQYEQYYEAVGGNKVMERHEVYTDPSDQQTRFISFSGGLDAPNYDTSLFLTSKSVFVGFGHNPSDMVRQIELTSNATVIKAPDTVSNIYMDAQQAWISHGNGVGANLARLTLYPTPGQMNANAYYSGYLTSGVSNTQYLAWGPGAGSQLLLGGGSIPTVLIGDDATFGSQLNNSGELTLRGSYWNGASSSVLTAVIRHEPLTTAPTSQLNFLINSVSQLKIVPGASVVKLLLGQPSFQLYNAGQTDGIDFQANNMRIDSAGVGVAYFQGGLTRIIPGSNNTFDFGTTGNVWKSLWGYRHAGVEQTIPAAASITLDPASGEYIRVTLSATAVTTVTSTAGYPNEIMTVAIIQDGIGGRSLSGWDSSFVFLNGTYTPSTAINARDILVWKWDATASKWYEQSRTPVVTTGNTNTFTKAQGVKAVALTDAATIVTDATLGNVFTVTLGGNRTLGLPSGLVSGFTYLWIVTQGAGGQTLAYNPVFTWAGGIVPVLSVGAGAVDVISAVYDGSKLRAAAQYAFS